MSSGVGIEVFNEIAVLHHFPRVCIINSISVMVGRGQLSALLLFLQAVDVVTCLGNMELL